MKHVIQSVVASGMLDGEDVLRLLYHTYHTPVSPVASADGTGVSIGNVAAGRTQRYLLLDREYRIGEEAGLFPGGTQQVKGKALGTLRPDARQLVKLPDEPVYGIGSRCGLLVQCQLSSTVFRITLIRIVRVS